MPAFRRRVAAVHEAVDEDVLDTLLLRHFEQRVEMRRAANARRHRLQSP